MGTSKGTVFNIQRCSLDDGPGLRTVVFMKGCNLNCSWCHNPESWETEKSLIYHHNLCKGCKTCISVCPENALEFSDGRVSVNRQLCTSCGCCERACPVNALRITGEDLSPDELAGIVVKDRDYYDDTSGGVTFSGGEPMLQKDFLVEVCGILKKQHIHIAMESNGTLPTESYLEMAPLIDLFILDLKHVDMERNRRFTGSENSSVIETIGSISRVADTLVRTPIIPGFNDTPGDLRQIAASYRKAGVKTVEFLPYHSLGLSKFKGLGIVSEFGSIPDVEYAAVEKLLSGIELDHIDYSIRGLKK